MGKTADGRRDRRHVSSWKRADVVAKVRVLEARRDSGMTLPAGRSMTVESWLTYWLQNIEPARVRTRTLVGYRSLIRVHVIPRLGAVRLNQLTAQHIDRAYAAMLAEGLSPATVLRVHRVVHRALKVAVQRDVAVRNVAALVEPPVPRRPETPTPLSIDEARRVLDSAARRRNAARWQVALALGLRQSEALGLQWSDVDFEVGSLSVRRGLHREPGRGLVFDEPKTERSRRTIALPRPLVESLLQHRHAQDAERVRAGSEWRANDLVFARENGMPIDPSTDRLAWHALLDDAGVRRVRLHDARHTAATLLLAAGIQPRVIMDLLGHSQMRTTTDIYIHVMPALAREAADRMATLLWD